MVFLMGFFRPPLLDFFSDLNMDKTELLNMTVILSDNLYKCADLCEDNLPAKIIMCVT